MKERCAQDDILTWIPSLQDVKFMDLNIVKKKPKKVDGVK